ncbi:MAG: CRTAC1 family protein [Planctomycetes bacterium]|nr:CRTAC1 family protein [Planctomycetota bacterium]
MSSGSRLAPIVTVLALLTACGEDEPRTHDHAKVVDSHARMIEALARVAERTADEHPYLGDMRARELRNRLETLGDGAPWRIHLDLGIAELRLGNERTGIAILENALARIENGTMEGDREARRKLAFYAAVGSLRLGETRNCCASALPTSCILPFAPDALHADREGSENAIRHLLDFLADEPKDSYWYPAAEWLLNLAALTLGEHPERVPAEHRIPGSVFQPKSEFPRFRNIAKQLGLDTFSLSGGVIADDLDGDDDLDLLVSTWDTRGQLRLFRNRGDGTFEDATAEAGLTGLFGGLNLVQADYDNDGDTDFLVLRGAWLGAAGRHPNSLVQNNGDGTFTDVTFDAGLGEIHLPTQAGNWADYDLDGDLDLYLGNESTVEARFPSQLFRNNGDGTFTDVARQAGVRNFRFAKSVAWGDYDGDGYPELYVSNNGQPNRLFHNRGDGTFEDLAERVGVAEPIYGFASWFWDYDNDGDLDLFAADYGAGIGHLGAYYRDLPSDFSTARLYRNDGSGGFVEVAARSGITAPYVPMGSNFGDLDGDGFLDVYLGTGNVNYYSLMPNALLMNRGGERFEDVTMASGLGNLQKGHGVAFVDFDGDGDLDVFEQMGGAYAGDGFRDALYENPGFGNRFVTLHLVGVRSNRSAIGANIRVDVETPDGPRTIYRRVVSGGSFGASPLRQTIGLGHATRIDRVQVTWPIDRATQVVDGVEFGARVRVIEGGGSKSF